MSFPHRPVRHPFAMLLAVLALGTLLAGGCANFAPPAEPGIHQVSTLQAIVEGVYDGVRPIGDLRRHGDLGIGTFHALDGELVMVDGLIAQVKGDGSVAFPDDAVTTPLASVVRFVPDRAIPVPTGMRLAEFTAWLDGELGNLNLPYAVRVRGRFDQVRTRSVPAQQRPYPRLVEVTATQAVFDIAPSHGDVVGFRMPAYAAGFSLPGYHLHYLDAARERGGHLLDFTVAEAVVEIQAVHRLTLVLPDSGDFGAANLSDDKAADLHQAER